MGVAIMFKTIRDFGLAMIITALVLGFLIPSLSLAADSNAVQGKGADLANPYCHAQQVLKNLKLYDGAITCRNDAATQKSLQLFQNRHGLIQSGVIDPTTALRLQSEGLDAAGKTLPKGSTAYSPADDIRPEAQPVAPLGSSQVNDANMKAAEASGPAATAENNYGSNRAKSHWVMPIPLWLLIVLAIVGSIGAFLVIGFLRGSKNRSYFK